MVEAATRCLCGRSAPARAALLAAALLVPAEARAGDATELRWTAAAPDRMVQQSLDAARRSPEQAAARLVLAACLHEQAAAGAARTGLAALGAASPSAEIADQARWLGRMLTPESEARPWPGLDRASLEQPPEPRDGMVRTYAILGPFEDAGGGLDRREGPERPEHRYVGADYSWGAYAVRTRRTLPESATARGLPLALYVHPRQESCTYLSSAVWLPQPQAARTALVHVAASGSFRLIWDGALLARGDEAHRGFMLDRARVQLEVEPGEHLLTVKMCSGASADDGRLRVRFTDEGLAPLDVRTSSSPERLDLVAERVRRRPPGARVLRAPTLLERALDLGPAATADQALGAALLRTLGGADDVQSPRAPGLLDRVVAAGTTPADALALAGYLSPSASNRSGWLGQALERALAQGDGETAGFAQRALVRARLEARLSDLARFSAEQPPLRDATDPQARLIKALARAALEGSGLRRAVLGELSALARELGPAAPGAVHEAIAELAEHAHAGIFLGAMRRLGALLPERRDARYLRALRPWGAAVLESAAARLLARQTSADQIVALGELLLDAGRYRAARDAFALATSVAPNRADGFALLGRAALRLAASKQDTERGLAALERARELDPGRAELAAELGLRRGEDEGGKKEARGAIDADAARYLVPAEVFLARARAAPATGEIFERELHWLRAVRYHPDKRVSQLMHYAREIVIEPRTESERHERLPRPTAQTELLLARVHRRDGTVLAPEQQDAAAPSVRWPRLRRGDVVEVAVRAWTTGPVGRRGDVPFYFVDYVGSLDTRPVLYNEVVVDAPEGSPLAFEVVGGAAERRSDEALGERRITHLVWERPPTVRDEPLAPALTELVPVVVGSAFPDWRAFLRWYREAVAGFTQPDDQIRRLGADLTRGKNSREEKIEALFNFVADDIRYVNYVSGEWWLPNRPQQLLARRQGDCDDKAMLLISLLRAVGIEATEVLLQTRHTAQPAVLQTTKVAVPLFDHGIVALRAPDGSPERYLDATSPQSRLGPLPAMDLGARALLVPDGEELEGAPPRILVTPPGSAADHGVEARWTIRLEPSGAGTLDATQTHRGDGGFVLRSQLGQADARAQWVEQNLVADWFPSIKVSPKVSFRGDLPGGAAEVGYRARSESLARREGEDLVLVLAPTMPLVAELAPLVGRTLPVVLPPALAPQHQDLQLRLEAPKTHDFAAAPPDSVEDGGAFGAAELSFVLSRQRDVLTVSRRLSLQQSRIEVAEYTRWRAWLQRIDRLTQRSIRLVPRAAAGL